MEDRKCVVFFGPPGSGKGTQAEIFSAKYDFKHLSTGVILRNEVSSGSELGIKVKSILASGQLVSDDLMFQVVDSALREVKNILLDGFPRTLDQAKWLDSFMNNNSIKLIKVVELLVDEETIVERINSRASKDLEADRTDDNESVVRERIKVFSEQTSVLRKYYQNRDIYCQIEGEGDISDIASTIESEIFAT